MAIRSVLLAALMCLVTAVHAQVKIGVIASATGPAAGSGLPLLNTFPLLPRKAGDLGIEYLFHDDASDPAQAARLAGKLAAEHRVDAIIGPPAAIVAETALLTSRTADETARWVFRTTPPDRLVAEALVAHMKKSGVRSVGLLVEADAAGDGDRWQQAFAALARTAGLTTPASERYRAADPAIGSQASRLIAAKPDAVLVVATGGPASAPHAALTDLGYKGRIYHSLGALLPEFSKAGGKKVDGALMAASPMLVLREIGDEHPSKWVALGYIGAYEKLHGARPVIHGASTFDAGQLLQRAIPEAAKKARPGTAEFRAALRDALEATRELALVQGVVTMSAQDHAGFDARSRVMMRLQDGMWRLLKD